MTFWKELNISEGVASVACDGADIKAVYCPHQGLWAVSTRHTVAVYEDRDLVIAMFFNAMTKPVYTSPAFAQIVHRGIKKALLDEELRAKKEAKKEYRAFNDVLYDGPR